MQENIKDDTISRRAAIDAINHELRCGAVIDQCGLETAYDLIEELPTAQPERLTNDDFETIRIHLNAYKEKLCNQRRWKEAEEYQRIIDRFMAFASTKPEQKKGKWVGYDGDWLKTMCKCSECGAMIDINEKYRNFFCYHCGARMEDNNESD